MTENNVLYASIALPLPINVPFTYGIPLELASLAKVGHRALVPFGKRVLTGFIIGILDNPGDIPTAKLKPLIKIIDDEPVFDSQMLELAKWIADYYVSSVGEVLKTAMPSGTMVQSRIKVHTVEAPVKTGIKLTKRQKEVLDIIREKGHVLLRNLDRMMSFHVSSIVHALEKKGLVRLERVIDRPSVRQKTIRYIKPTQTPVGTVNPRAREQARCVDILAKVPDGVPFSEFVERYDFSRGVVNAVVAAGFAYYTEVEVLRRSKMLDQDSIDVDHPLTEEQLVAFRMFMDESASPKPQPVLLKGVTGSGKTRLYIEIVREMLKKGKSAIILVPEISLTPQTTRFFSSVFPDRVAVLHSAMSPGERFDMWNLIHDGKCDVVIGPRSAVFAPLPSPGVIIVDEEHDTSYKQADTSPRYHARDVAVVRGNLLGIPVVLGSATPSIESWHNALQGKYVLFTLSKRVKSLPMPEVRIVDMRMERAEGNKSSVSRQLRDDLRLRIERGEKSIIMINRRGFATGVQCRDCGEALTCPQCAVTLTYHSSKRLALCHLCGHKELVLEHCPECGSNELQYRGKGTQSIEKELEQIAGNNSIIRMDSDTTSAHDAHYRLLEEFRTSSVPILLGTQMVAKGHDFPGVTLVGIISADLSLYIPDFRAGERTFQLITQVAGRAGRGDIPGVVILQTFNPDNYAVTAAMTHDYDTFAEKELAGRKEAGYPPFSRLILVELSSTDKQSLEKVSKAIAGYFSRYLPDETEILGPVEASVPRIRGRHRIHILLKSTGIIRLLPVVRHAVEKHQKSACAIAVDVDPIDLL